MKIITDNKWHEFKTIHDVPAKERHWFDYLVDADIKTGKERIGSEASQEELREWAWKNTEQSFDGFLEYKNTWYHTSMFETLPDMEERNDEFNDWDGHHGDSFFSGVLIKLSEDGEYYKIGTYLS